MVEIWLFGSLFATLASGVSVVLLIVAFSSVTYLGVTLVPVLRLPGPSGERVPRRVGLLAGGVALALSLVGLRVGSGGGDWIPTLGVSVAAAAAIGTTSALGWLLCARASRLLLASLEDERRRLGEARAEEARRLAAGQQSFSEGRDLRAEVAEARGAVERLRAAVERLRTTHTGIEQRLARTDPATADELAAELARAKQDVATKIGLGERILGAAEVAAFRLACTEPLRSLLRRRPRELSTRLLGLAELGPQEANARIEATTASIAAFLADARSARERLAEVASLRPAREPGELPLGEDPWALARRDLDAVEAAYVAVDERLEVVWLRLSAKAEMTAVASAAGQLEGRARASGLDARELGELLGEVTRAESAIAQATPGDSDAHALAEALLRSSNAFDTGDGGSVEDLLDAMREVERISDAPS